MKHHVAVHRFIIGDFQFVQLKGKPESAIVSRPNFILADGRTATANGLTISPACKPSFIAIAMRYNATIYDAVFLKIINKKTFLVRRQF
jgi:hypothetical protein